MAENNANHTAYVTAVDAAGDRHMFNAFLVGWLSSAVDAKTWQQALEASAKFVDDGRPS